LIAEQTARLACESENSKLLWVSESLLDLVVPEKSDLMNEQSEMASADQDPQMKDVDFTGLDTSLLSFDVTVTDCPGEDQEAIYWSTLPSTPVTTSHSLSFSDLDLSMDITSSPSSQLTPGTYQKWQLAIETSIFEKHLYVKLNVPKLSILSLPARIGLCRDYYRSICSNFSLKLALSYRNRTF